MNENQPPIARKVHTETQLHGAVLTDDYAWLRDKQDSEVTAYLEAENAYAEAVMAPLAELREDLYKEMLSHIKQTDVSVPFRDGAWWYYTRTEEGQQYAIHCRKPGSGAALDSDALEHVVLDGNELAKGHAFFAIGETAISE
ncbi:MAG: oligopeptidase B, partial [Terracidiphilus sp.]